MAEPVEDGVVGVFVWNEDLFSIGEGLRGAFELLGGHLGVPSLANEDLAEGYGSVELPLALYAVEVGTGGASVPGKDQGFVAVEPLHVFAHAPLLGELAVSHVDPDPAHRVDDPLEPLEIHDCVMVYGYARVVLQRVDRLIYAAIVVGGVYLVLFSGL